MNIGPLIAELSSDNSDMRRDYVTLVVDHALKMPLQGLFPLQSLTKVIVRLCEEQAVEALFTQVIPIVERCGVRLAASGEVAGAWVAPKVETALPNFIANPDGPRMQYLAAAIDPTLMRQLLAPVLQDVLNRFVARLPAALGNIAGGTSEGDGGLLGRLGRDMSGRGRRLLDVGLSVVSGLGLEQKLESLAADFSQQAVGAFRDSLSARLRSEEGRALVQSMGEQGIHAVLKTPLSVLQADLDRLPLHEVLTLVPSAVAHAAKKQLFGELLDDELQRFYSDHGQRSASELLTDLQVIDVVRNALLAGADEHARLMFASEGFSAWFAALVSRHSDAKP